MTARRAAAGADRPPVAAGRMVRHRTVITSLIALGTVLGGACTDLSPGAPFSLELLELPAPSIVSGDSLRDIDGVATPIRAIVFNVEGDTVHDAEVTLFVVDTSMALTLDQTTGVLVATGPGRGSARIFASIGSLQAPPETLTIVSPPAAVVPVGVIDTLRYSFADPSRNTSDSLAVRVADAADAPVARYQVRFRLADRADTVSARLVDDQGRISTADASGAVAIDTTGADGVAFRRLRITPGSELTTPVDSIVVFADVRVRGSDVPGSPVRLVLYASPIATP